MAGLLDFSTTSTDPQQLGAADYQAPASAITYPDPAMQGAVTGIANGVAQSVQAFFQQLPVQLGLATPQVQTTSYLPGQAGGLGVGTILLIGAAVFLLARKR